MGVKNFEHLLGVQGIGAATVRDLCYISALVYGAEPSWSDPARYQWAFGTKSGYPWHVQKKEMKKAAEVLKQTINEAKLGRKERMDAIKRLSDFVY